MTCEAPSEGEGVVAAPILILSNPRTGSTLLRLLLDTHPAICSPGDLLLGRLCDSLYAAVEATCGPMRADESIETRRRRCLVETRRILDELLGRYCAARRKPRWCEKSPANLEFLPMLRSVFPDARCLCLHRHCLDVVHSAIEMYGAAPWHVTQQLARNHGNLAAAWIERWCEHTETLLAFEAENPERSLRVRYEDLVGDPDGTLAPILAFVGVPWVPGLAEKAFAAPHDLGRGDPKIAMSAGVAGARIGRGRRLDLGATPQRLVDRMRTLLDALGYGDEPAPEVSRADEGRIELSSVAELFTIYFPRRLAGYAHRLEPGAGSLVIRVTGSGGGTWTVRVDSEGARILPGGCTAPCVVTFDSADLLNAANRRLTVPELRDHAVYEGDVESFDRALGERLIWALLAEDFRPHVRHTTAVPAVHATGCV